MEIQLLIENSEERLTEDQVETLINIVTEHLPSHVEEEEEGENGEDDDNNEEVVNEQSDTQTEG